jgi:hypothetical protein
VFNLKTSKMNLISFIEYANNKVEVEEGYKVRLNTKGGDPNLTELYIERGINIYTQTCK